MPLALRALEMHGQRMWERERVVHTLRFMQRNGLNALVLHESDLVHQIVYPRKYFDPYALWSDLPSRRGENAIFNRRAYFDHLLRLARDADIDVWVNVKEIGFSDEVLAIHPEVFKDGAICPSEPFWREYVAAKADELFTDFPLLEGMIVSFGSQESRASRVQNRCRCELCRAEPLDRWYSRMIDTLHIPIARHRKTLAVRDFAYKPQDHEPLIAAVERSPADVVFCIKAMPHDFYVTFPDNPAIGRLQGRTQWIEYDTMGQFFGWGVMPCLILDDIAGRLPRWTDAGATGAIFRIEWERINDLDAFDTLAEINLIASAAIARDEAIDSTAACRRWIGSRAGSAPLDAVTIDRTAAWLAGVLDVTLSIVRGAAYIGDHVSADNSMLPRSIQRAWWGMESRDSLAVWDESRAPDLVLDRARLERYLREKDDALAAAQRLVARIGEAADGVDPSIARWVRSQFDHYVYWIEGLRLCAHACLWARWLQDGSAITDADRDALAATIDALDRYAARGRAIADDSRVPHQVVMLIDPQRAMDIVREARAQLSAEPARAAHSRSGNGRALRAREIDAGQRPLRARAG